MSAKSMRLEVRTNQKRQIVDLTDQVNKALAKLPDQPRLCQLTVQHTTAALTTADLDPGTDLDMLDAFEQMIPKLSYRHPHDPTHVPDHIMAALIGPTVSLPVEHQRLTLGTWQRVVLCEFSGPRPRQIIMTTI